MSEMLRLNQSIRRKQKVELSVKERQQLNTIVDLLIPSDKDFPPPSSLQLIDTFIHHLLPKADYKTTSMLNEKRLRTVLNELNTAAGGDFCLANEEKQQRLLHHLEQKDPAFFQTLWTIANHSYYTMLAQRLHPQLA